MSLTINSGHDDAAFDVEASVSNYDESEASSEREDISERSQIGGAAAVAGLTGLVLLGPVSCLVMAGGAAAAASTKTRVGEVARSTGGKTVSASKKLYSQKDSVVEKASSGVANGYNWFSKKMSFSKAGSSASMQRLP